jgi:hypothetical protein
MPYKDFKKRSHKNKKRSRRPRLNFSEKVLSVVNKQRELKVATFAGELPITGTINDTTVLRVMPEILQAGNPGSGASTVAQEFYRDGNQVNIKKIVLRWWITQKVPADQARSRVVIRHMILRQRGISGGAMTEDPTLFKSNQLLENSLPFTGTIPSLQLPINKAEFVARMDKRHYLSSPTINQAQLDVDADQINSFKMGQKTLTFGKGKMITWGTGGASNSSNFPYFMTLGGATVDGVPVDNVIYNYTSTVYFHDS